MSPSASRPSGAATPATRAPIHRRQRRTRLDSCRFSQRANNAACTSTHSKRGVDRIQQSRLAEWLQQALHRAIFQDAGTEGLISVGGDKDDRNLVSASREL